MLTPLQWSVVNHMVAYELSPPDNRLSHSEFAKMVGISEHSIHNYGMNAYHCPKCGFKRRAKKIPNGLNCVNCGKTEWVDDGPAYPEFRSAFEAQMEEATKTNDFFALRSRQWSLEEMVRLYSDKKTTDTNKRHILKTIHEMTADAQPIKQITDFDSMPNEELERLVLGEMTDAERSFNATITGEVGCLSSSQGSSSAS